LFILTGHELKIRMRLCGITRELTMKAWSGQAATDGAEGKTSIDQFPWKILEAIIAPMGGFF